MPKGIISFETPDWVDSPDTVDVPVYDPAEIDRPGWKTFSVNGEVVAARLAAAGSSPSPERAVKVAGPDGEYWSLAAGETHAIDGFESGQWPDDWTHHTGRYGLTTDAIEGAYSLECTSSPGRVVKTGESTPRGWDYRTRVVLGGAGTEVWLLTNIQDPHAPFDACYAAVLDADLDELRLRKFTSSGPTDLDSDSVSGGVSPGTDYDLVVETTEEDTLMARVESPDGTWLANSAWTTDADYTGGYIGVNTTGSGAGTRYDDFRQLPPDS